MTAEQHERVWRDAAERVGKLGWQCTQDESRQMMSALAAFAEAVANSYRIESGRTLA